MHKIKIFGEYLIHPDGRMSIDSNLFFNLNKVSFISEEIFSTNPIGDIDNELSFYFSFILDGILIEVRGNQIISYRGENPKDKIAAIYPNLLVFKLRRAMIDIVFIK